jgi:hypothetical protein
MYNDRVHMEMMMNIGYLKELVCNGIIFFKFGIIQGIGVVMWGHKRMVVEESKYLYA